MTTPEPNVLPEVLVRGIAELEPLPITAQQLIAVLNGQDVPLSAITELIEYDQAIAASVLRAASSVRYAGRSAATVRDAVHLMGTVALLDLVMGSYLRRMKGSTPLYDLHEGELWRHGAAAQLAVRALSEERTAVRIPEIAGTAALLHDIGKLIIARHLATEARDVHAHADSRGLSVVEAERVVLGFDHADVGAAIATAWHFPDEVTDAIRRHHRPPFEPTSPLLDAVVLANVIAKTVQAGLGTDGQQFAVDPDGYRRLGISFDAFGRICLKTESALREMASAHGLSLHR